MDPAIRKMSRELAKLNQPLHALMQQAIDISREVGNCIDRTADSMSRLGSLCLQINKCYKSCNEKVTSTAFEKIESIYSEFSKTLMSYSKILIDERENFGANVENLFNFSACEIEGIDEVATC